MGQPAGGGSYSLGRCNRRLHHAGTGLLYAPGLGLGANVSVLHAYLTRLLISLCSLEHCPDVSDEGLRHLAAGLPLLRELRLYGSGVSPGAAALVMGRALRGRLPKLGTIKPCWWVQGAAGRTTTAPARAPLTAPVH